jgi:hypothetical protein
MVLEGAEKALRPVHMCAVTGHPVLREVSIGTINLLRQVGL